MSSGHRPSSPAAALPPPSATPSHPRRHHHPSLSPLLFFLLAIDRRRTTGASSALRRLAPPLCRRLPLLLAAATAELLRWFVFKNLETIKSHGDYLPPIVGIGGLGIIWVHKAKQGGDHDEPEPQFEREREPQPKENETVENVVAAQVAQQAESEIVEESPQVAQQAESEIVEERPQVAQQAEEEEEEEDEGNFLFKKLNGELEKVNQFYTSKEEEYLRRGELLDNQLQALLSMRREQFQATRGQRQPMRIHILAATPWQTITSIASRLRGFLVHNPGTEDEGINYNQLQEAGDMIRKAYIDLYTCLNLLKTYSTQNMGAFAKMEKKFDKVFNKEYRQLTTFFRTIERSYFICSEKDFLWRPLYFPLLYLHLYNSIQCGKIQITIKKMVNVFLTVSFRYSGHKSQPCFLLRIETDYDS